MGGSNRGISCAMCAKKVGRYEDSITCFKCESDYHIECVNLSIEAFHELLKSNKVGSWKCVKCLRIRSEVTPSVANVDPEPDAATAASSNETVTLSQIYSLIVTVKEKQDSLATSLDSCHEKIDRNTNLLQAQEEKIQECLNKIDNLETKNNILSKENEDLKQKLNDLEQYTRMNSVEIKGVPEIKNENVINVIAEVRRAVGFSIDKSMIDACHRLKANINKPNEPRGIILKFVSRIDKLEFLNCKRGKRNLKVRDLGDLFARLPNAHPDSSIYINESLTTVNRVLFSKARSFAKQNNIKYAWIRNGHIAMRKTDDSKVFIVKSTTGFNDVH
uniref:PHD-type domain-containing protein n=1 Tax=Photinus pyralis TaxID=7054 RepID=A0A1Y1LH42_PHOPY